MEKHITFSVPFRKKCDDNIIITPKLRFIDSFRFMNFLLSDLIVWTKCMEREKNNSGCCFVKLKNDRLIYRCIECKEKYKRPIEGLIRKFPSIYQFCNSGLNKFLLLLRKGVYLYEDMDNWGKIDETTLPPIKFKRYKFKWKM